jgi:hypothetical protein
MNRKNKYLQLLDDNNLSSKDLLGIVERSINLNSRLACIYMDEDKELAKGCLERFKDFYGIYALIANEDKSSLLNDIQLSRIKGLINAGKEQEQC